MIDFYFDRDIKLDELLQDENLAIKERGELGDIWIGLANKEEFTALWVDCGEDGWFDYGEGHDAALPVAFYLYEKHGILFHDDCEYLAEVQDYLDISTHVEEWNAIVRYVCYRNMARYVTENYTQYQKFKTEVEEARAKHQEIMDRTGIEKTIEEKHNR